jgi:hypothetical protein
MADTDARATNLRIAAAYDAMPYDMAADERLDPERVLGWGALYGATHVPAMFWISAVARAPSSHARAFRQAAGLSASTFPGRRAAAPA